MEINITPAEVKHWSDKNYPPSKICDILDYNNFITYPYPENIYHDTINYAINNHRYYRDDIYSDALGNEMLHWIEKNICDEMIYLIKARYLYRQNYEYIENETKIDRNVIKRWISVFISSIAENIFKFESNIFIRECNAREYDKLVERKRYKISDIIDKYPYPENLYRAVFNDVICDDVGYTDAIGHRLVLSMKLLTKEEELLLKLKFRDRLSNKDIINSTNLINYDVNYTALHKALRKMFKFRHRIEDDNNRIIFETGPYPYSDEDMEDIQSQKTVTDILNEDNEYFIDINPEILIKYTDALMDTDNFHENIVVLNNVMPRELDKTYKAFKTRYTKAKWLFKNKPNNKNLMKVYDFCRWTIDNIDIEAIQNACTKEDIQRQTTILDIIINLYTVMKEKENGK